MVKIKLAVADDHEALRNALIKLFQTEPDLEVVVSAHNGVELLKQLRFITPDVIIMDIRMPQMDGIEATKEIGLKHPSIKVIAHTQYDSDDNIIKMYHHGVKSFICKGGEPSELITAIRVVYKGGNYVTDSALSIFKSHLGVDPERSRDGRLNNLGDLSKLSSIELIVIWHTALLKSIKQIAKELHLSPHTVNNHQANIRKKLNLNGRNSLVRYAVDSKVRLQELQKGNL